MKVMPSSPAPQLAREVFQLDQYVSSLVYSSLMYHVLGEWRDEEDGTLDKCTHPQPWVAPGGSCKGHRAHRCFPLLRRHAWHICVIMMAQLHTSLRPVRQPARIAARWHSTLCFSVAKHPSKTYGSSQCRSPSGEQYKHIIKAVGNGTIATPLQAPVPDVPAAQPTTVQRPPPPECAPPPDILQKAITLGATKASYSLRKTLVAGIMAGALLSFGAATALTVGGACPGLAASNPGLQKILLGSIGLPFGLLMVVVSGGELFTGNTCFVTTAVLANKATWGALLKNWTAAYAGNVLGSLVVVALMSTAGVFGPSASTPLAVAVNKTSMPFMQVCGQWGGVHCLVAVIAHPWLQLRPGLCTWCALQLVGVHGTMAGSSNKFTVGQVCLLPAASISVCIHGPGTLCSQHVFHPNGAHVVGVLTAWPAHCAAHHHHSQQGMALGAPVNVGAFVMHNLLPVTLGNIVGGVMCVALVQSLIFGKQQL